MNLNGLKQVKSLLPEHCQLIVVSKTRPLNQIMDLYNAGERNFAENRVQNLIERKENLPEDIRWHLIGHLQTNKVKYVVPFVHLIHSLDSIKLAEEIEKQSIKNGRVVNCLIQVHVAAEETKFGLGVDEIDQFIEEFLLKKLTHIQLCGVMGMATNTRNTEHIRNDFRKIYQTFLHLKNNYFKHNDLFSSISMGMSSDYKIAIEEGSTMVRIGSLLFE